MKLVLKILGGLVLLIVLGIGSLFALPFWPVLQDQFGAGDNRAWLAEHRTVIELSAEAPVIVDDTLEDARFIMLAELHGYRAVQALDLRLVEQFAAQGPARTYLAELGPDQAMAFNLFLHTGEDAAARGVFDAWAAIDAQWANQEFYAKLERLRALNASLPQGRQIWFVGVDSLGDDARLAEMSALLTGQAEAGFSSYEAVQALNARLGAAALERGDNTSRYTHILSNIEIAAAIDRERAFYGLWGLFHGSKTTVNGSQPLAMRLNAPGGAFEDSVVTLTAICVEGCFNMMPAQIMPAFLHGDGQPDYVYLPMSLDNAMLQRMRGVGDLKAAMGEAPIVAFRLSGQDSPYDHGARLSGLTGYLSLMQTFNYGGPAAQVSDYVIAIRGSAGLTPWNGVAFDTSGGAGEAGIPGVEAALR